MTAREDEIVAAFVSMAGSLVEGGDITELLDELVADCSRLLDVTAVGLLLADRRGACTSSPHPPSASRTWRRCRPNAVRVPAMTATSTAGP